MHPSKTHQDNQKSVVSDEDHDENHNSLPLKEGQRERERIKENSTHHVMSDCIDISHISKQANRGEIVIIKTGQHNK